MSPVLLGGERQRESEGCLCTMLPRVGLHGRPDMRMEAVGSHALLYERKLVSLELRKRWRCHGKLGAVQTRASGMHG